MTEDCNNKYKFKIIKYVKKDIKISSEAAEKVASSSNVYFLSKLISGLSIYAYKYHCVLIALESITKNVIFSSFLPRTCGF